MSFNKVWYIIPYYIRKLPGMTLAYLDIYETVFEFLNNGQQCFLSNSTIMERTGIKNDKTIRDGLAYFEKALILKRVIKNGKRFIVKVNSVQIEDNDKPVDNSPSNCSNIDRGGSVDPGGRVCTGGGGGSVDPHKNKINNINLNKSFCASEEQKKANAQKHEWAKSPFADVTKQSTSYNPNQQHKSEDVSPILKEHMEKNNKNAPKATIESPARTEVQPQMAEKRNPSLKSTVNDVRGYEDNPPTVRGLNGLLAARSAYSYLEKVGLANSLRSCET